ncbi:MAG: O-antigen ligase family protein [Caldimonas sp.]|uniref:O-antigen ligase family protein n=1 Tax=Caldimonas sp. TaxID=2838790 RepID=UPI00391E01CC
MPEHLRALVVILGIAIPAFWLARRALCDGLMTAEDFDRRRKLWFAVTLLAFLSHSFWLYIVLCGALLLVAGSKERNPGALYALLIVAVPGFEQPVPGMGLINYVFDINHVRLLNLAILLPAALRLSKDGPLPSIEPWKIIDRLLLAYLLFSFVHRGTFDSATGTLRFGFYLWIDIWLPYFVLTRSLRTEKDLKECMAALVLAVSITAVIAVFETTRYWLVYESLRYALQLPEVLPMYLTRGEGGSLRANVTSLNAIALGYTMMIGLIFGLAFSKAVTSRWQFYLLIGVLVGGLIAALSRGPWVGAAVGVFAAMALGPGGVKRAIKLMMLGAVGFGIVLLTPYGAKVIDLLPFVGTVEPGSVEYRQRLFVVSMIVFWESPIFGLPDYLLHPAMEEMRQGQGIIDVVNTYLGVALYSGAVGLFLFVAPFLCAGFLVWRLLRKPGTRGESRQGVGRALLGALVGAAITIATVSSITVIPAFYWFLLALCATFVRLMQAASPETQPQTAHSREASSMGQTYACPGTFQQHGTY